jgi:hypothetical protein
MQPAPVAVVCLGGGCSECYRWLLAGLFISGALQFGLLAGPPRNGFDHIRQLRETVTVLNASRVPFE